MALETGTYISDLNAANPTSTDPKSQGDDHLRLIKSTLLETFPEVTGEVTASHIEINLLAGKLTVADEEYVDSKAFESALPLQTGNSGKFVTTDGSSASWGTVDQLFVAREEQTSGTAPGDFNNLAWRTRTINTVVHNSITGASLSSNKITLPAGKYLISARAPARNCNSHKARIYDVTNGTALLYGQSMYNTTTALNVINAEVNGVITLTGSTEISLEHRCSTSGYFGIENSFSVVEVYSDIVIRKKV